MNRNEIERAALNAADLCLKSKGYIALADVFREMGKVDPKQWEDWRFGRIPYLERVIRLNLSQINGVCRTIHASAKRGDLKPSWTGYHRWGKGPRVTLRFTKSGDPKLEKAWATHYLPRKSVTPNTTAVPMPEALSGTHPDRTPLKVVEHPQG